MRLLYLFLLFLTPPLFAETPPTRLHEMNTGKNFLRANPERQPLPENYCGETFLPAGQLSTIDFAQQTVNEMTRCQMCTITRLGTNTRSDIISLLAHIAERTTLFYVKFNWHNYAAGQLSSITLSLRPIMGGFLFSAQRLTDYLPQNITNH